MERTFYWRLPSTTATCNDYTIQFQRRKDKQAKEKEKESKPILNRCLKRDSHTLSGTCKAGASSKEMTNRQIDK